MSKYRWCFKNDPNWKAPFYSKGRGRTMMVSDFIVQHPSSPFIQLSDDEWAKAISKYPSLAENEYEYIEKSPTSIITLDGSNYFDNPAIIHQFRRLFQIIEFKEEYKNHAIEVIVDNATTHSAKSYNLRDFRKSNSILLSLR